MQPFRPVQPGRCRLVGVGADGSSSVDPVSPHRPSGETPRRAPRVSCCVCLCVVARGAPYSDGAAPGLSADQLLLLPAAGHSLVAVLGSSQQSWRPDGGAPSPVLAVSPVRGRDRPTPPRLRAAVVWKFSRSEDRRERAAFIDSLTKQALERPNVMCVRVCVCARMRVYMIRCGLPSTDTGSESQS